MGDFRPLLAVADRRDAPRRDAERDEHVLDRLGAALAKREVVFAGAALVAMSFDRHRDIRIAAQPLRLTAQDLLPLRLDVGLVIVEEDAVAGRRGEILLRARSEARAADAAGAARSARRRRGWCVAAGGEQHKRARDSNKSC